LACESIKKAVPSSLRAAAVRGSGDDARRLSGAEQIRSVPGWIGRDDLLKNLNWRSISPQILLKKLIQPIILKPFISGVISTVFILGIRFLGTLEPFELWVYDRLLANRPQLEMPDPRILVVTITQEDLKKLGEIQPISDRRILEIMEIINDAKPKVIGLNVIRDTHINDKKIYQKLAKFLIQNSSKIVASCSVGDEATKDPGFKLTDGFDRNKSGFTNLSSDHDNIIRRQILGMAGDDTCPSDHSLSLRLAARYFGEHRVKVYENNDLFLHGLSINILTNSTHPYQDLQRQGELRGYQVMINYRAAKQVADQVSIDELLNNKVDSSRIRDKIVLVGYAIADDRLTTPLIGSGKDVGQIDGVLLHAHMVSQLVSAVEDGRPLIWLLPLWLEWLYLLVWSILGSVVMSYQGRYRTLLGIFLMGSLGLFVWGAFTQALWLPSVPTFLTFVSGAICIFGYGKIKQLNVSQD
jgi:CHASE2 domain-containing sensor protein